MIFLVVVILLEIFAFVEIGSALGGFATIVEVVLSAVFGIFLIHKNRWSTVEKIYETSARGETPAVEMLSAFIVLAAGILLIIPGFVTDFIGALGVLPWPKKYLIAYFLRKNTAHIFAESTIFTRIGKRGKNRDDTIEGEFWED